MAAKCSDRWLGSRSALIFALVAFLPTATSATFSKIGDFPADNPGFVWVRNITQDDKVDLIITSFQFNPVKAGAVQFVDDIASGLEQISVGNPLFVETSYDKVFWPNDVKVAPQGIWKAEKTLLVSDGFLLAGKTPGNIVATPLDRNGVATAGYSLTGALSNVSNYGTFHTLSQFVDFKGKGQQNADILATKVHESIYGPKTSHLVMLMQPQDATKQWPELVLAEGPDFAFETLRLSDKVMAVWVGSFFKSYLDLLLLDTSSYPPSVMQRMRVDNSSGAVYSIQLADLDGDGAPELLVSNHQPTPDTVPAPALFAYKMPIDVTQVSAYRKFTLASGFACYKPGTGKAAPGWPFPFYPNTYDKSGPMHILLSGDDNGGFYVLSPGESSQPFNYNMTKLVQYPGTVGKPEVADVDGDGWVELFLPDYEAGRIQVFTSKP